MPCFLSFHPYCSIPNDLIDQRLSTKTTRKPSYNSASGSSPRPSKCAYCSTALGSSKRPGHASADSCSLLNRVIRGCYPRDAYRNASGSRNTSGRP
jgi:hypothetical protein